MPPNNAASTTCTAPDSGWILTHDRLLLRRLEPVMLALPPPDREQDLIPSRLW